VKVVISQGVKLSNSHKIGKYGKEIEEKSELLHSQLTLNPLLNITFDCTSLIYLYYDSYLLFLIFIIRSIFPSFIWLTTNPGPVSSALRPNSSETSS